MPIPVHQIPNYKEVKTLPTNVNNKTLTDQQEVFLKNINPNNKTQGVFLEKVSENKEHEQDKKTDLNSLSKKDNDVKEI